MLNISKWIGGDKICVCEKRCENYKNCHRHPGGSPRPIGSVWDAIAEFTLSEVEVLQHDNIGVRCYNYSMKKYIPKDFEGKWQQKWAEMGLYKTDLEKPNGLKHYVLAELPYPSGDLHMGHWFTFAGADFYARLKRMQGYNVFFPVGFDAFGLPAENAAIKKGIHPQDWTMANIKTMKEQFKLMGGSFSFDHEVITCLPEYYKWNQWIFLKMLEKGLAYKGKYLSNWCNTCQTVLANEAVESGNCWRCGTEVEQKEIEQWFFKITDYAEKLIWLDPAAAGPGVDWPQSLRDAQNNWIGKSEGALIKFPAVIARNEATKQSDSGQARMTDEIASPAKPARNDEIEVFTTRPDTIFGATFLVISPEYPGLMALTNAENKEEVEKYIAEARKKSELERKKGLPGEALAKTGVFTGSYAKNPLTGEDIPIWVADYVLMGYGTGAIMAVPAHDDRDLEFAQKYKLEIKNVVGDGILINSGEFNGLSSDHAKEKITNYLEEHQLGKKQVQYHLRDWSISRQRYWGTPIPIIYCDKCGMVPVPEKDLPVELPYEVDYTPKGKPPLASNEEWLNVKCPKCDGLAKREAETMDTFVDSSWYFFRYLDPKLDSAIFDPKLAEKIMPVDIYFGGPEHNLGHTLYARFIAKFLDDLGLVKFAEFAQKRFNHGIVLGPDGNRMSKSKGNVVNPDEEVKKYGADTIRVFLGFFMPYDATGPWVPERIWGAYRFLERVWGLSEDSGRAKFTLSEVEVLARMTIQDNIIMHKTIKKVGEDIENLKFNTAIAALMEWLNYLSKKAQVSKEEYETFLLLLAPFAPHMTEELWNTVQLSVLGDQLSDKGQSVISTSVSLSTSQPVTEKQKTEKLSSENRNLKTDNWSIHQQPWPKYDEKYLEEEEITIVVQVNGKVRDNLVIQKDIINNNKDIEKLAKESPKIQKYILEKEILKVIYVPGKIINLVLAIP